MRICPKCGAKMDDDVKFCTKCGFSLERYGVCTECGTPIPFWNSKFCANCGLPVVSNTPKGFVDLGLSVLWAECNIGAEVPEEFGDYYAWGETSTKMNYSENNCPTRGKLLSTLKSSGIVDANGNLTAWYDVAQKLGKGRMPTFAEIKELKVKCLWMWIKLNGVKGYEVTGPNGNSIFLPAAGSRIGSGRNILRKIGSRGYYWSSTVYGSDDAYTLYFDSGSYDWGDYDRYLGRSVRPVMDK